MQGNRRRLLWSGPHSETVQTQGRRHNHTTTSTHTHTHTQSHSHTRTSTHSHTHTRVPCCVCRATAARPLSKSIRTIKAARPGVLRGAVHRYAAACATLRVRADVRVDSQATISPRTGWIRMRGYVLFRTGSDALASHAPLTCVWDHSSTWIWRHQRTTRSAVRASGSLWWRSCWRSWPARPPSTPPRWTDVGSMYTHTVVVVCTCSTRNNGAGGAMHALRRRGEQARAQL